MERNKSSFEKLGCLTERGGGIEVNSVSVFYYFDPSLLKTYLWYAILVMN